MSEILYEDLTFVYQFFNTQLPHLAMIDAGHKSTKLYRAYGSFFKAHHYLDTKQLMMSRERKEKNRSSKFQMKSKCEFVVCMCNRQQPTQRANLFRILSFFYDVQHSTSMHKQNLIYSCRQTISNKLTASKPPSLWRVFDIRICWNH